MTNIPKKDISTARMKMLNFLVLLMSFLGVGALNCSTARADLTDVKNKSFSEDATNIEEAFFHGAARSLVIRNIAPNKLNVGGAEFRVKRNPVGKGCFVYNPRIQFSGVERKLVWWVTDENTAYALNSPSKMLTPSFRWPRDDGLLTPSTSEIVDYVFDAKKILSPPSPPASPSTSSFTIQDYRIYRIVMDSSVPETEAIQNAGKRYRLTAAQVKDCIRKVQTTLSQNKWFGSPELEIKRATDWKGEKS